MFRSLVDLLVSFRRLWSNWFKNTKIWTEMSMSCKKINKEDIANKYLWRIVIWSSVYTHFIMSFRPRKWKNWFDSRSRPSTLMTKIEIQWFVTTWSGASNSLVKMLCGYFGRASVDRGNYKKISAEIKTFSIEWCLSVRQSSTVLFML